MLDPGSLLRANRQGVNIVLARLDDWQRYHAGANGQEGIEEHVARVAGELIDAVRTALAASRAPLVLAFCPESPAVTADETSRSFSARALERVAGELEGAPGLSLIRPDAFRDHPAEVYHDAERDRLGHIPYTPLFFAVLGTALARKIHSQKQPPYKVIVLDCDNTLWKGVVGEEGVDGIEISPGFRRLQEFMVERSKQGFLICLCSKNDEADVLEVLDRRADMVLKREHLVSWRVNWRPKSESMQRARPGAEPWPRQLHIHR